MPNFQSALNLIKPHEGLRLSAYKCPAGVWTIGYGCRIRNNNGEFVDSACKFEHLPVQKITESQAEKMLIDRVVEFANLMQKNFKNIDKLSENQYNAFLSLVYNCGIGTIGTGLKNLIENDPNNFDEIRKIWLQYNKSGGKILGGLTKRRQDEVNLYCLAGAGKSPVNTAKNPQTNTTFSKPMNSILSMLADKGIDIATSLIPGGSLVQSAVKSIAKNLLGNEDASEEEVRSAIANATPEQLENLRLEIAKMETQVKIEQEDTLQAIEKTNQMQIEKDAKFMDLAMTMINSGKGKYLVAGAILYYVLVILTMAAYRFWFNFDIVTQHTVISMLTVMAFIPFSPFIGNGVMNKILNSLCDIFLNLAEIGKGISAAPKMVLGKIVKKKS